MGHRMSSLPVVQFCGMAGKLSAMGSGRSAAQSSAFHATCAGAENAYELCSRLTQEEMEEIQFWKRPTDVDLGNGRILRYADAEKELEVGIDLSCSHATADDPDCISVGHLDFAWVVTTDAGLRIAYVADIKRSEYTVTEGVASLQLHAYGLAYASKHRCDAYVVGLWAAVEGRWQWSDIIDLESKEALTLSRRVVAAALNTTQEYAMGPHCRGCYGRLRCPAWILPPELSSTKLAPLAEGNIALNNDNAADLLLTYQRYEDAAKVVASALKEFAVRNGGIRDGRGKVWKPVVCQGRESVSVETVRKALGPEADKLITQGKPYERFSWVNDRSAR